MSNDLYASKIESFQQQITGDARYFALQKATAAYGVDQIPGASVFSEYVVIEVISDPKFFSGGTIDEDNKTKFKYKESNKAEIPNGAWENIPRNSIIGKPVNTGTSKIGDETELLLPFFPSHLALPCKPGEHVWVMHPSAKTKKIGYWFCKVVPFDFVDDVNHTHYPRIAQVPNKSSSEDLAKDKPADPPDYKLGAVFENEYGEKETSSDGSYLSTLNEKFYEELLENTDSSKIMVYEPVPRFKKRPGDVAIEGSNNTLIVLGTDRNGPYAIVDKDPDGKKSKKIKKNILDLDENAGSIDIVAGRGQTPSTSGRSVFSKKQDKKDFKKELNKLDTVENEGDPDFIHDKSRILVSQRTKIDEKIKINSINKNLGIYDSEQGDASVMIKSDKIRLTSRKDIQFLANDDNEKAFASIVAKKNGNIKVNNNSVSLNINPDGSIVLNTSNQVTLNIDKDGKITLTSNADVIINPGAGMIKLGGESADNAILCQKEGSIIQGAMGTQFGTGGLQGVFSSKVRVI